LLFAILTRGRRVHYGAGSIISAACVSVEIVYICNKVVASKVG